MKPMGRLHVALFKSEMKGIRVAGSALLPLASAYRWCLRNTTFIAVTGSSGKSTTVMRISVVTVVGDDHIKAHSSHENVAQEKGEIVACLAPDGIAVLNVDDPLVRAMAERTRARTIFHGQSADAKLHAVLRREGCRIPSHCRDCRWFKSAAAA